MRKDEGYWAAVLLVGLANLTITKRNWRSLWGWHLWPTPPGRHDPRSPSPAWQRWNKRMMRLDRQKVLDELGRALETHIARYNDSDAAAPRQDRDNWLLFEEADRVPLDARGRVELADFSSYIVLRPPIARTHAELRRALGTLRERLGAIADGQEARLIEAARAILRARPLVSLVIGRVERPPEAPKRRPYDKVRRDDWHDGFSHVRIFDGPADHEERLGEYLDGLLLRAAQGGYWARIARCTRCAAFVLRRVSGRARVYCSDGCRNRTHHTLEAAHVRARRHRRRDQARADRAAQAREVASRIRAYQSKGYAADAARRRAQRDLQLTDEVMRRLMR